ncbi:MAG: hypothetical protein GX442_07545 [Candidatus Riflebacteria bacterium]|nr:hypothetical protein [Candidatus Riflebacteria bacterium]
MDHLTDRPAPVPPPRPWKRRAGMAGLIIVIIVLGYMMNISMSHSYYVQAEMRARASRDNSRKAYYAALAGINFVLSRLRLDTNNTYVTIENRLYFARTVDSTGHNCPWMTGAYTAANNIGGEVASDTYRCYNTFTQNLDTNPAEYLFLLNTYPGPAAASEYLVKCQGIYQDLVGGNTYRAQLWAKIFIDTGSRFLSLVTYRSMPVQKLTPDNAGLEPDDFWDWQNLE